MRDGHKEIIKVFVGVVLGYALALLVNWAFPYRPWTLWGT